MILSDVLASILTVLLLVAAFVIGYFVLATRRIATDAERRVPPAGSFVTIDGNRIHYVEAGQGRPILFLHGLGGQLLHFRSTLFADLSRDFRVIALDRPGSGYSTRVSGATGRLPEQAALIDAFIATLGLERPLVVGHSLGGTVALALALGHPAAISGLARLAPMTHLPEHVPPEFKALHIVSPLRRWLLSQTVAVPMALKYAGQTLAFTFGPQSPSRDYMAAGGGLVGLRPSHVFATSTDLVGIDKDLGALETRYETIAMPVGILFGTADRVLDHRVHGLPLQDRISGLDLELLDGIGHMVQFSATERAAAFVRKMAARAFG